MSNEKDVVRWRDRTVNFAVSKAEKRQFDRLVKLSGLTQREYCTEIFFKHEIVLHGNPRIYKMLRSEMRDLISELSRIERASELTEESQQALQIVTKVLLALKEENPSVLTDNIKESEN